MMRRSRRQPGDVSAIFVHAGAGFHSYQNEKTHLKACSDAVTVAMTLLKNGATAVDAVEMSIKVLEDREITNSGFGSNLALDGAVECDATMVDHYGRSGACGAVSQIKNPISLARTILDYSTRPMPLQRVPPNLLVAQGATDFAFEHNFPVLPHDYLISTSARERWIKWRRELEHAERHAIETRSERMERQLELNRRQVLDNPQTTDELIDMSPSTSSPPPPSTSSAIDFALVPSSIRPLIASAADTPDPDSHQSREPSDYVASNSSSPVNMAAMRPYVRSPLKQVMQQDGTSRSQSDSALNSPEGKDDKHEEGSARKRRRRNETEEGSLPSQSRISLEIPSRPQSPPLFPVNPHVNCAVSPTYPLSSVGPERSDEPKPPELIIPEITVRRASQVEDEILHDYLQSEASETKPDTAKTPDTSRDNLEADMHASPKPAKSSESQRPVDSQKPGDKVTDTVGAIAIDCYGNIAAGSSSGGIGMKHRGRTGPAALVGVGTAVVPEEPHDPDHVSVAVVTSGTGEHMATTLAASTAASRIYSSVRKVQGGALEPCTEDEALKSMIEQEFMGHPGVRHSHCAGAIGIMGVKKLREGIYLYFAHNTDSFAIASMSSEDRKPVCTMSRNEFSGMITTGGRSAKFRG